MEDGSRPGRPETGAGAGAGRTRDPARAGSTVAGAAAWRTRRTGLRSKTGGGGAAAPPGALIYGSSDRSRQSDSAGSRLIPRGTEASHPPSYY